MPSASATVGVHQTYHPTVFVESSSQLNMRLAVPGEAFHQYAHIIIYNYMTQPSASAKLIASSCWLVHVRAVSPTLFPAFLHGIERAPPIRPFLASQYLCQCLYIASLWLVKNHAVCPQGKGVYEECVLGLEFMVVKPHQLL